MDNKTLQSYNKIAARYGDSHKPKFWQREFLTLLHFLKWKKGRKYKVLDIGCGYARDAFLFIGKDFDYTGIDASKNMIREARKRVKDGKFKAVNFFNMKFPSRTFDAFWASASLHHAPKQKVDSVLHSIYGIIKPGGVGFISVKLGKGERVVKEAMRGYKVERFFAFYTPAEFKRILERAGFKVLKITRRQEGEKRWLCFFVRRV